MNAETFNTANPLDDAAYNAFHGFWGEVENLQATVGSGRAMELDTKDPDGHALSLLRTAVDGSGNLTREAQDFLLSDAGKATMERSAESIVRSWWERQTF